MKTNGIALAKAAVRARIENFPVQVRPPLIAVSPQQFEAVRETVLTKIVPLGGKATRLFSES